MLPSAIRQLSKLISQIPSIGPKSAEKIAIWLSSDGLEYSKKLADFLSSFHRLVGICPECGYFSGGVNMSCEFCSDLSRDQERLCVVEKNIDIIEIEAADVFKGLYFVLGGLISPLEGKTISSLPFPQLKNKVQKQKIREVIIALGTTTEADITTMYLKEFLKCTNIELHVLARGLAVGTQIHYASTKSIEQAFRTKEKL